MSTIRPILIVEDQPRVAKALALLLDLHDLPWVVAEGPEKAVALIGEQPIAAVIQDMNFTPGQTSGEEGTELFRAIRRLRPEVPILLLTAWASVEQAVRLIRDGAADYLEKPWDDDHLVARLRELVTPADSTEETRRLPDHDPAGLVYASRGMRDLVGLALKVARADVPVLITGPNGSGKERVAELVQRNSSRCDGPFVKVNVGALPDTLLEAELFGAEAGAFTGATRRRAGRFEAAQGGTLLLDEIGNLSATGQAKLLRVLQTGEYERLGSSSLQRSDVRILAATNVDLEAAIERGEFREDLYFRLNVIELAIPALADRPEDVLPLADHFVRELTPPEQGPLRLSRAARSLLQDQLWPGNVRELRNRIQRAVLVAPGHVLRPADLGLQPGEPAGASEPEDHLDPEEQRERSEIEAVLQRTEGVVSRAAESLGLSRQALYRRMDRLGIVLERRPRETESS